MAPSCKLRLIENPRWSPCVATNLRLAVTSSALLILAAIQLLARAAYSISCGWSWKLGWVVPQNLQAQGGGSWVDNIQNKAWLSKLPSSWLELSWAWLWISGAKSITLFWVIGWLGGWVGEEIRLHSASQSYSWLSVAKWNWIECRKLRRRMWGLTHFL